MSDATASAQAIEGPRVIAEFTDAASLESALRHARVARNISFSVLDAISGLCDGQSSKLLAPNGSRRVTLQSLGLLLGALGLKGALLEDAEALRRVARYMTKNQLSERDNRYVTNGRASKGQHDPELTSWARKWLAKIGARGGSNSRKNISALRARQIGKRGGHARAAALTPLQRSDAARRAVRARWAKRDNPAGA